MQGQGDELNLGVGASHAVCVDYRDAEPRSDDQGHHRVGASDLRRHHCGELSVEESIESVESVDELLAERELLDEGHWRAHQERKRDHRIVIQLRHLDDPRRAVLIEAAKSGQGAEVRIATTPRAEHRGSASHVLELDRAQGSHRPAAGLP